MLSEINAPFGDTFANGTITVSNGQHTFQVRALNDAGTLLATNTVTATVTTTHRHPPDTTPPTQPATCASHRLPRRASTIAWNAATDNVAVTGYDIYRAAPRSAPRPQPLPINGLTCGTAYSVGVRAFDAAGNSSPPANMTVTTSACPDSQPPTAPTNVTASTRTTTSIALTWAPATDNVGVAGYGVYNGADLVHTTAGTTGIVSGLTCGTSYTLAVDAFDATGNSSPKTAVMVSTLPCSDTTPPTQPTNLRTTSATTTSLTLAWNASTDNVAVAQLRHLPRHNQSRHRHHNQLHAHRAHLRNQLHRRRQSHRHHRQHLHTGNRVVRTSPCAPQPQSCPLPAYPDASCTGVPAGTTLTPSGSLTITTAGTVINARTSPARSS